jgi:hypothetical protein
MVVNQHLIILCGIIIILYLLYYLKLPQREGLKNRVKRRLRRAANKAKEASKRAKQVAKQAAEKAAESLRIDKSIQLLFKGVINAQKSVFNVSKLLKN